MLKNPKGITVIALIITIIIMLILVAITMNVMFGENGLITKTKEAKLLHEIATIKEEIDMYEIAKEIEEKVGIERFPVLNETMADIDTSSIPEALKVLLLQLATTVAPEEVPTIEDIDYSKFYKLDKDLIVSAQVFAEDLYLWQDSTGYKVISLKGVEYKGKTIYVIIPLDDMADPKYIATSNNTYKLYGDGTLKVIGQVNDYATLDSSEIEAYSGIREFIMPEGIPTDTNTVPYFSCGTAYVIDTQNRLWAWGDNTQNKLGLGHSYTIDEPTIIRENVKKIWAGMTNAWILGIDNKIYAAGSNTYGTLGQGDTNTYNTFVQVEGMEAVAREILCNTDVSYSGAIIVCEDGKVYGVGRNASGELGLGNKTNQARVVRLPHFEGAKKIRFRGASTYMLTQDGEVWACGSNSNGRIGIGTASSATILTKVLDIENAEDMEITSTTAIAVIKTEAGEIYRTGLGKKETDGSITYDGIPRKANLVDTNIILSTGNLLFLDGIVYTLSYDDTTEILDLAPNLDYSSYINVVEKQEYPKMAIFKNNGKIYINNYPDITASR